MASSRDARVEDTYELQNDQRLDDLHSKLRTLRGVCAGLLRIGCSLMLILHCSGYYGYLRRCREAELGSRQRCQSVSFIPHYLALTLLSPVLAALAFASHPTARRILVIRFLSHRVNAPRRSSIRHRSRRGQAVADNRLLRRCCHWAVDPMEDIGMVLAFECNLTMTPDLRRALDGF